MQVKPVTLELPNGVARLEPLRPDHAGDLLTALADGSIFRYMPIAPPTSRAAMDALIREAFDRAAGGAELPFAIVFRPTGRAVGSTRYLDIQRANRSLEIGWTWVGAEWQRSRVNTECKYLLLRHAFETLGAVRVQIKTDTRNERSQRAIERLGAVREGVLRRSRVLHDGYIRDTVYYSILDHEWPPVRARLEAWLDSPPPAGR